MVKPVFHGEAMLRRVNSSGEAVFMLDDTEGLRALVARQGRANQRFAMVLVEIDDDGRPAVDVPTCPELRWGTLDSSIRLISRIGEKGRSQQAAILCQDPGMGWYLYARRNDVPAGTMPTPRQDDVVRWMRDTFDIESRSQLDGSYYDQPWRRFLSEFVSWCVEEKMAIRHAV
jgi:hypothetical protein